MKVAVDDIAFLVEDIRKLEDIMALHEKVDEDDFMISQYKARKAVMVKDLIQTVLLTDMELEDSLNFISLVVFKLYKPSKKTLKGMPNELVAIYNQLAPTG